MVWLKDSPTTIKRHPTREQAEKEADRIALLPENLGKKVYVLEAMDYRFYEPHPLMRVKL
jgi:hypothetical protein